MILLDKPYISDFLLDTIADYGLEVIDTPESRRLSGGRALNFISQEHAVNSLAGCDYPLIYTASENSLAWVAENMAGSNIARIVEQVKNKARFRELIQPLYPDFYYREVALEDVASLEADQLQFPFVIKPSIGFFSLGVYVVDSAEQWPTIRERVVADVEKIKDLYPDAVLNTSTYLIEQVITGREFAFDAYYDDNGEPVILNILEHFFAGPEDVSDRIYMTSRKIISECLGKFRDFLSDINHLLKARNFVVHVEVRITADGRVVPIEINPMRFGGWCTTADLTWYAYGENSYLNFLKKSQPDWQSILSVADDTVYALVVLDNSTGTPGSEIVDFDYNRLLQGFVEPLELRKANWKEYPLFGYFFTATPAREMIELTDILSSDLREFCRFK